MFRSIVLVILASALLCACSNDSEVPRAVAVAVTTPAPTADMEILIASQPPEATVVLKGAKVGETPMKLLVRGDTNIILEKEGYVQQALMITPKSEPNLVVTLVPLDGVEPTESGEEEVEQEEAVSDTVKKKKSSKKKTGGKDPAPSTDTGEEDETDKVVPTPPSPTPETKTKKPSYNTMAQIKKAIREGKITKAEFRKYQAEIRRKRAVEVDAAKKAYQQGKLTKTQYKEKIRSIKIKYEG